MGQIIGCKNCQFISCNCNSGGLTPGGGACHDYLSDRVIGFSNCLFVLCTAAGSCGALYMYNPDKLEYALKFSFFFNNYGQNQGNDAYFGNRPSHRPFFHCFSTTSSSKIYNGDDNWFP